MSARVQLPAQQPVLGNGLSEPFYSSQASSQRPPSDTRQQPYESPVIPDYVPSDTIEPTYAPSGSASVPRKGPHRRSQSHAYPQPTPPSQSTAKSYGDLGSNGVPVPRSHGSSRPRGANSSGEGASQRYASAPQSARPAAPDAPTNALSMRRTSGAGKHEQRRSSVPDRSPLQTLEVKLDDISKEEKRARVMEAERAAHERMAKSGRRLRAGPGSQASGGIGAESVPKHDPSAGGRRAVPQDRRYVSDSEPGRNATVAAAQPRAYPGTAGIRRFTDSDRSAALGIQADIPNSRAARTSQPPTDYESHAKDRTPYDLQNAMEPQYIPRSSLDASRKPTAPAAAIFPPAAPDPGTAGVSRNGSRKLQKGYTQDRRPAEDVQMTGNAFGPSLAQTAINQTPKLPNAQSYIPSNAHRGTTRPLTASAASYLTQPQTTAAEDVETAPDFESQVESGPQSPVEKPRRRWGFPASVKKAFDHDHDDARRYVPQPFLQEWRNTNTASLFDEDLDLETPRVLQRHQDRSDKSTPWWEKPSTQRRRSSGSHSKQPEVITYDGNYDERTGQTFFSPPLYLKCGPLLRFTGIHTQKRPSGSRAIGRMDKEIWRGSILIVTADAKSSYETLPTLRLFKQPVELLPPPPAQIDAESGQQLAPEYVDPVAGQVKMSRIGKTLYVKPVEYLDEFRDLSRVENDKGLFSETLLSSSNGGKKNSLASGRSKLRDGEKVGKVREIQGTRLHSERGVTFWKFKIEVELGAQQARIAYRINNGPAIGFWVPARGQSMNIMFHSCNGFSLSVNSHQFSGPDPMWRDVLNAHQFRPFHVMIGGGDQLYNDGCTVQTTYFREWSEMKNPMHKNKLPFSEQMQEELETFYLNRYAMWFSQGLFGLANCQIPMVNIWDDHDIIDGYGSYPHHTMSSPVMTGIGAVAFKYYMLFQHHSLPQETEQEEPSWLLGASPGPYIEELSRSLFMFFGRELAFLGLDCRTERMRDEILSGETYDLVFERLNREVIKGETKHLIVLLGIPIAYPRLNFLENVLTSRVMDPVKALGRTGMLGGFVNKFDGGVEILDDLDDHWTAKHHKDERNWFIQELQEFAAEKSVRITILGGDVHLCAVGQFYSNKKLGMPKDRDHRYMPNIISSAIVNTPPSNMLADIMNRRNRVHHLDPETDEDMISMFPADVDGKPRKNRHLMPRRNWCSIREYEPGTTPPPTPPESPFSVADEPQNRYEDEEQENGLSRRGSLRRTLSIGRERAGTMMRRLSRGNDRPPISYYNSFGHPEDHQATGATGQPRTQGPIRASSADALLTRPSESSASYFPNQTGQRPASWSAAEGSLGTDGRPSSYHRRPSDYDPNTGHHDDDRQGYLNLAGGLDVRLNVENVQGDPAGTTTEYRLLIPALEYDGPGDENVARRPGKGRVRSFIQSLTARRRRSISQTPPYTPGEDDGSERAASMDGAHDVHTAHIQHPSRRTQPAAVPTQIGNVAITGRREAVDDITPPAAPRPPYEYQTPTPSQPELQQQSNRHRYTPIEVDRYTDPETHAQQPLYPAAQTSANRRAYPASPPVAVSKPQPHAPGETRIGADGRPLRRRWRSDPYDEDAMPANVDGAGDEHAEEDDEPMSPPSQMPYDPAMEKQGKVKGRRRWLNWKI